MILNVKFMDWFLYDNGRRHERVKWKFLFQNCIDFQMTCLMVLLVVTFVSTACTLFLVPGLLYYYFLIHYAYTKITLFNFFSIPGSMTKNLFLGICVESSISGCCLAFANFLLILACCCILKCCSYKSLYPIMRFNVFELLQKLLIFVPVFGAG